MAHEEPSPRSKRADSLKGHLNVRIGVERKERLEAGARGQGLETTEALRRIIDMVIPPTEEDLKRVEERRSSVATGVRKAVTDNPGATVIEIEEITGIPNSSVRAAVVKLEQAGVLMRVEGRRRKAPNKWYPIPGAQISETKRAL
ncbi:hypothetical protein GCM10010182_00870 [Actinomadura cremea]|nr:hypothetical protein GCM10010182_00870 [Actinomadura cremea]